MGLFLRLIVMYIENNTNNDQVAVFEHYCHGQNNNVNNCYNYNNQKMPHKMSCNRLDVVSKVLEITISLCFVCCYCYLMCLSCTNMTIIITTIHLNPLHPPIPTSFLMLLNKSNIFFILSDSILTSLYLIPP